MTLCIGGIELFSPLNMKISGRLDADNTLVVVCVHSLNIDVGHSDPSTILKTQQLLLFNHTIICYVYFVERVKTEMTRWCSSRVEGLFIASAYAVENFEV